MLKIRRQNAQKFKSLFENFEGIKVQSGSGLSSWFAFSLILEHDLLGKRDELARELKSHGIECRPIIAGNFTKQPVMKYLNGRIPFPLTACDWIHENGIYVGNHPFNLTSELNYLYEVVLNFTKRF
jgi:CDP-6-deoxy-D-xylo-4-hexulose-3-dehydrase